MIQEVIENRIEALTPNYREFIFGIFIEVMTDIQATKLSLLPRQKEVYENGLVLYLLFFISLDELIEFVTRECEVEKDTAEISVKQVIYQLPSPVIEVVNQGYYTFATTAQNATQNTAKAAIPTAPNTPSDLTATNTKVVATGKGVSLKDIAKQKEEKMKLNEVKGMRTMRSDVDRLRNDDTSNQNTASQFTKPFQGS